MTIKWRGVSLICPELGCILPDAEEPGRGGTDSFKAEADVSSKVMKSRGVVGPGNCAESW